jgi:methylenetetrahydrofolate dehydrogenase (NADP+)/methenyltetrahydrofolate cyclohydrolase
MRSDTHRLPETTSQDELLALIAELNADAGIHGILVQLPLPAGIDSTVVLDAIDPDKDVDGFHVVNAGRLAVGLPGMVPCTPLGSVMLLKDTLGDLSGLNAVIVGRSNIVGKPMAQLLLAQNCTVTIAHSRSRDLPALCRHRRHSGRRRRPARDDPRRLDQAGRRRHRRRHQPRSLRRSGQGRRRQDPGRRRRRLRRGRGGRRAITPVPGGVGPMTIACLLANTYVAACRANSVTPEPLDA